MEELIDNCIEGSKGQGVPEVCLILDQVDNVSLHRHRFLTLRQLVVLLVLLSEAHVVGRILQ